MSQGDWEWSSSKLMLEDEDDVSDTSSTSIVRVFCCSTALHSWATCLSSVLFADFFATAAWALVRMRLRLFLMPQIITDGVQLSAICLLMAEYAMLFLFPSVFMVVYVA
jgi:hypothetical protein